ncbi:MAG: decarboxylating 6-phosphogluconate dehydrogenase [Proteobacteria bacterium]|nr:decarboxylating 6-phosphogluconate dehydrogenase [Pseudomonadota bacterium]MBU4295750.1 decarboxylating 6-phosphogluconate dehydrogenase [Pseudomonadota bacterium]MCG2747169.1 decarboxylating 6-phosphogluconate dehydrogenase [Desulfobulbaceae bacterium]
MKIGIIGLGRMGMNMARRLMQGGHQVVAYNRSPDKTEEIMKEGSEGGFSLQELAEKLDERPKVVWLMLPAGKVIDEHLEKLRNILSPGDIIVEGGNSKYRDDIRRAAYLKGAGIHFIDAGVSGGIWGLKIGYCTMVGGDEKIFNHLEPVFKALAPVDGYLYCGPTGAGHFVKMIHNGIEYGMMQAYGEGFALLEASPYAEHLDFKKVSHLWNQGSVVRSWLLELLEDAFAEDPRLDALQGYVDDSGEGRWTVEEAIASGVAAPVITMALFQRFQSRKENAFENRVLAALRQEFGGHAVKQA